MDSFVVELSQNVSVIVKELSQNATVLAYSLLSQIKNANSASVKGKMLVAIENMKVAANETYFKLQNQTFVMEQLDVAKGRLETMDPLLLYAYIALLIMAVIPIICGSMGSIKYKKKTKSSKKVDTSSEDEDSDRDETEFFKLEEAQMFPIYGSITLFSLYLMFKYFDKELINYLMTAYFGLIGVGAASTVLVSACRLLTGLALKGDYKIQMFHKNKEFFYWRFGGIHLLAICGAILLNSYYVLTKHWIVSNFLAESFAISAVQLLNLDSFSTGMVLLSALFVYDVFWVFGTDVMVTVAKNFDAPIKVTWPKDIFAVISNGIFNKPEKMQFTMLGLGDIVIPGIYICLCLQFDYHLYLKSKVGKKHPRTMWFPKPYFWTVLISYILGLVVTVLVMHGFQSAQPALLYLSPACIFSSFFLAVVRGEVMELFKYKREGSDAPKKVETSLKSKKEKKTSLKSKE